jgi:phage-related baseplate assembly protein
LTSAVLALHGFGTAGVVRAVDASAFGAHAAVPFVAADHPGGTAVYVSLVVLSGVGAAWTARVVAVVGTDVTVRLPGGDTVTVRLPAASTAQRAPASIFERVTADGRTILWPPDRDRS